jgi:transcriptional regulator with XRE-family HTH domain
MGARNRGLTSVQVKPLRLWRAEQALGLKELAAKAGVSHATILRIERAETLSQPRVYRKLAQALGIEPLQIAEYRRLMGVDQGVEQPDAPR